VLDENGEPRYPQGGSSGRADRGLIEALSIARSITVRSNQHINGNQEFIGQGLSNIAGSFFSSYASSGSFTRSGVNFDAGARTPMASIFSALFLAVIVVVIAPLTAWLPLSAMGGVILFVAFKLIDFPHIKEILRSSRSETLVLLATFLGTLFFEIEFAIYTGVLLSMAIYLTRTSHPHVDGMVPDPDDPGRRLNRDVIRFLRHGGFLKQIGENHLFVTEYQAISRIFTILDKSICRTCTARIFEECRGVPGPGRIKENWRDDDSGG
jgi:MFS superfamily sulfate permease-like transporter